MNVKQRIAWYFLHLFWLFPIKKNRISFLCYGCKQYSCNPKYISEYLYKHYKNEFELIWYYDDKKMKKLIPKSVKAYKKNSILYFYSLLTSRIVISNMTLPRIVPFRVGQLKINTWHGTAFKGDNNKNKNNYNMFDVFLAENELSSEVFRKPDSFAFSGKIWKIGMPRNDILIAGSSELTQKIKTNLGINMQDKVVLYAPTFRDTTFSKYEDIDSDRLLISLMNRFGGQWKLLYRIHHMQKGTICPKDGIDVTDYPDMQELLLISDVLITDYSSSMWDFSLTGKPVMLYVPDLEEYIREERGEFFYPFSKLPFLIVQNNHELSEVISSFDSDLYIKKCAGYYEAYGRSNYNGDATRKFVKLLKNEIGGL